MKKVHKAELYIGRVKHTENQKKKHITQMTKKEIAYLKNELKLLPSWQAKMSKHLIKKRVTVNIQDVEDTLVAQNVADCIVEYNETIDSSGQSDRRILIRCDIPKMVRFKTRRKNVVEAMAHLCFVISLDTYSIVTAYWNKISDDHESINWERYSKHLSIIK